MIIDPKAGAELTQIEKTIKAIHAVKPEAMPLERWHDLLLTIGMLGMLDSRQLEREELEDLARTFEINRQPFTAEALRGFIRGRWLEPQGPLQ
jgi:hypothetical protein